MDKNKQDILLMQEIMQEKSPIKARIIEFIELKGLSKYEFYQKTGITRGILGQNNGISEDNLTKFLAYYKEVSPEWILTGEGNMFRSKKHERTKKNSEDMSNPNKDKAEIPVARHCGSGEGIPLITVEAMAGFAKENPPVLEYECERYVVPMFRDAEFLITVKGSSMIPKYNSGDIVACKMLPLSDLFFQWNKVYVLDTVQGALIKRVKAGHDKEHILIVSDNDRYEPFELHMSQVRSVALVIGVIRLE